MQRAKNFAKFFLMGTSSINIQPVKSTSETHNLRLREFDYVRKDLTSKNFNWGFETKLSELRQAQEKLYQEKVGQKMQKKAAPIREGVFLFEERHTNEQLLKVVQDVEAKFGIKAVQLSVHRDEGYYEKQTNVWKPNLHAHVVFDYQNKNTGKTVKLRALDLSALQTHFAEGLGMERGKRSSKTHLNALEFKAKQIEKDIKSLEETWSEKEKQLSNLKKSQAAVVRQLEAQRASLKSACDEKEKELSELKEKANHIASLCRKREELNESLKTRYNELSGNIKEKEEELTPREKIEHKAYLKMKTMHPEVKELGVKLEREIRRENKKGRGRSQ